MAQGITQLSSMNLRSFDSHITQSSKNTFVTQKPLTLGLGLYSVMIGSRVLSDKCDSEEITCDVIDADSDRPYILSS